MFVPPQELLTAKLVPHVLDRTLASLRILHRALQSSKSHRNLKNSVYFLNMHAPRTTLAHTHNVLTTTMGKHF